MQRFYSTSSSTVSALCLVNKTRLFAICSQACFSHNVTTFTALCSSQRYFSHKDDNSSKVSVRKERVLIITPVDPTLPDLSINVTPPIQDSADWRTIPNLLTLSRIVASPCIAILIAQQHYRTALALTGMAGITDFLDGYLARRWNQTSVLGSFLDPLSDKVLVAALALPLALSHTLNPWIVGVVVLRDILLVGGVGVFRYRELPPHQKTAEAYFSVANIPTHEIVPNALSKWNTGFQIAWIFGGLISLSFDFPMPMQPYVDLLGYLVLSTTVASGISYAFKRGVRKTVSVVSKTTPKL